MRTMGDTGHLHHLHVFELKKLKGHRDVEASSHANGRYKVRIEPHDGHHDSTSGDVEQPQTSPMNDKSDGSEVKKETVEP